MTTLPCCAFGSRYGSLACRPGCAGWLSPPLSCTAAAFPLICTLVASPVLSGAVNGSGAGDGIGAPDGLGTWCSTHCPTIWSFATTAAAPMDTPQLQFSLMVVPVTTTSPEPPSRVSPRPA